ncbi:MAG: 4Fe-4S cluster-binding domain-containing protein [Lachnospiraceae bacterium]
MTTMNINAGRRGNIRYASIRELDISNGNGIGIALFVQGCHFHCKNCFNQETWDFNGGKKWTPDTMEKFLRLADRPYINRISILGGEPLAEENIREVTNIASKCKKMFPDKKIWLWSGYNFKDHIYALEITSYVNQWKYQKKLKRLSLIGVRWKSCQKRKKKSNI